MKKLRRLGIADATAANAFLEATSLPEHNARFAQAPAATDDFHRRTPSRSALDRALQLEDTRVLSNDWVIRYDTRYFQVVRQSHLAPARSTVLVREAVTAAIEIRYRGRLMQWTEIAAPLKPIPAATRPPLSMAPPSARSAERGPSLASRHPRHRPRACAEPRRPTVKSLWKLTQPWTPRTRPPLLGKPTDGFSTSSHRPYGSFTRGHFYFAKNGDISISP